MLKGLTRGLQMIAQTLNVKFRATAAGNAAAVAACDLVISQWFQDLTGVILGARQSNSINVVIGLYALLFGDPFKPSRALFQSQIQPLLGKL